MRLKQVVVWLEGRQAVHFDLVAFEERDQGERVGHERNPLPGGCEILPLVFHNDGLHRV